MIPFRGAPLVRLFAEPGRALGCMTELDAVAEDLVGHILNAPRQAPRRLVALAGAPASGKTTLAQILARRLHLNGCAAQVVPMDGFHLDNRILSERGALARKGAPETFDSHGFLHLIGRLTSEAEVIYPIFDRTQDIAIANAAVIDASVETVIVEGNYLLFDAPIWRDLSGLWDLSIRLDVPLDVLEARLIQRWVDHGLSLADAKSRAAENDLKNARTLAEKTLPADITV